ncbi:hypothetical protein [Pedobacter sp. MC2016-05]
MSQQLFEHLSNQQRLEISSQIAYPIMKSIADYCLD